MKVKREVKSADRLSPMKRIDGDMRSGVCYTLFGLDEGCLNHLTRK